jgi:serine/threonine-protein kinase RsbW
MATVQVTFTPLPAHVRTARLVATAVARRSGVDEALLDEVRLAVGEACSRAVEAHRRHCPAEPVRMEMTDLGERFEVVVRDAVPAPGAGNGGASAAHATGAVVGNRGTAGFDTSALPAGFGLAVISGLADDVRISATGSGVSVRMTWPAAVAAQALRRTAADQRAGQPAPWQVRNPGHAGYPGPGMSGRSPGSEAPGRPAHV